MNCDSQSHLRYQNALVNYQKLSSQDSSLTLYTYCREHHIHHKGMKEWLTQNNLSIKPAARTASKRPKARTKLTNQDLFLEVAPPTGHIATHTQELNSINVSLIFSDGTHLNIPQISIPQIAQLAAAYSKEVICLG